MPRTARTARLPEKDVSPEVAVRGDGPISALSAGVPTPPDPRKRHVRLLLPFGAIEVELT